MSTPAPPCRLYVFLARAAPYAMILRKGPSRWVESIGWNTKTDTFEPGQWFKGRIYERKCDLSPDGQHFVYFAHKANNRTYSEENRIKPVKDSPTVTGYQDSWTAISRPPFLTAVALWPQGTTYGGGGLFLSNNEISLQNYHNPHIDHQPPKSLKYNQEFLGTVFKADIHASRLQLGGWQLLAKSETVQPFWESSIRPRLWKKTHSNNKFSLLLWEDWAKNSYTENDEYRVVDESNQQETVLKNANWADYDQQGRLVFARDGQLWADQSGTGQDAKMLIDLNPHKPEAIESPSWAKEW